MSIVVKLTRSCVTPSSKKYTKRANKSQVMMKYGDVDSVTDWAGQGADVDVSIARRDNSKFRYMFQKLQDKSHGMGTVCIRMVVT